MDTKLGWRGLGGGVALGICLLLAPQARAETDEAAEPMAAVFDLPNPPEIRSVRGLLDTTFVAKLGEVTVGGQTFTSNDYNRLYIPPTLRVKRGDRIRLQLVNRIQPADVEIDAPQPTNIHFHGMDVTPLPPGDNVFVRVEPGKAFNYDFLVPANHPEGLHWYHSHLHTVVDPQILSGLSGMLIVDGGIESHYPEFAGLKERVMVLKDVNLPGSSAPSRFVNGLANPPIRSRPGELQIWEIGNLGADGFFDLALEGHEFWVLERDGNFLRAPRKQQTLFLPPGARTLVVVRAGAAGRYFFQTKAVNTGPTGLPSPRARLGTFIVEGQPLLTDAQARRLERPAANIAGIGLTGEELRTMPVAKRRTFTFSDAADFSAFYINGKTYDEDRIDTTVRLGDVEEWTIKNAAGELHVFHLHQTSFLVKEVNGVQQDYPGLRDVINVPWQSNGRPGEVKLLIPFTNPIMVGKFVYHCHIVGHEDAGMMQNVEVVRQRSYAQELWDDLRQLAADELPTGFPGASTVLADAGFAGNEAGLPPGLSLNQPGAICRPPRTLTAAGAP
ncbi:MAG: multicopper oxidase domain-containing protein [Geminicoccaceae bacterium]